jgi:NosR/NirI family transcriptional regulator, nitrous oxide reductase regulator
LAFTANRAREIGGQAAKAMKKFERIPSVVPLVMIVAAWIIGGQLQAIGLGISQLRALQGALPEARGFKPAGDGYYIGENPEDANRPIVGYAAVAAADGYGGPIQIAVGVDMSGNLTGAYIVNHKETPAFFDRIKAGDYLKALVGRSCTDPFIPGEDIDAVSGATVSLDALATSVRRGSRRLAVKALGLPAKPLQAESIRFGLPEILLILLFAASFLTYSKPLTGKPKARSILRWATRLAGLLLIGFVLTAPLSIININSLLAGFGPHWRVSIYWYLLIIGAFLPVILTNKNVYCQHLCPFGATQDILKLAGGAKYAPPKRLQTMLRWTQRFLAMAVILTALLFRNPAVFNYEVFGTFFTLTGTVFQFALLGIVLIASLFLIRPWCNFLCPIRVVSDYLRMWRLWITGVITTWRQKSNR